MTPVSSDDSTFFVTWALVMACVVGVVLLARRKK
jgi:hypothetical protein